MGLNWKEQQLHIWNKWDWPDAEALIHINQLNYFSYNCIKIICCLTLSNLEYILFNPIFIHRQYYY